MRAVPAALDPGRASSRRQRVRVVPAVHRVCPRPSCPWSTWPRRSCRPSTSTDWSGHPARRRARGTPVTPERPRVGGAAARRGGRSASSSTTWSHADFPFLGACYGIGTLGPAPGRPSWTGSWPEPVGPAVGDADRGGPGRPAVRRRARRLRGVRRPQGGDGPPARREPCSWRRRRPARCRPSGSGSNVYATQFHPELDLVGVCTRIEVYKDAGYFDPERGARRSRSARAAVEVRHPMTLLANFVAPYHR